jgi:hypothetical protein
MVRAHRHPPLAAALEIAVVDDVPAHTMTVSEDSAALAAVISRRSD